MSFTTAQMQGFSRKGEQNAGDCSWGAAPDRRTWIGKITKFSMREYPGEHARAELVGIAETQGSGTAELFGSIKNCSVELYAEGEERAIYSGIVQRAQSQEENGYRLLRLELGSGSLLMDMEKEKRTFQDISMTYGQVITQIRIGVGNDGGVSTSAG